MTCRCELTTPVLLYWLNPAEVECCNPGNSIYFYSNIPGIISPCRSCNPRNFVSWISNILSKNRRKVYWRGGGGVYSRPPYLEFLHTLPSPPTLTLFLLLICLGIRGNHKLNQKFQRILSLWIPNLTCLKPNSFKESYLFLHPEQSFCFCVSELFCSMKQRVLKSSNFNHLSSITFTIGVSE